VPHLLEIELIFISLFGSYRFYKIILIKDKNILGSFYKTHTYNIMDLQPQLFIQVIKAAISDHGKCYHWVNAISLYQSQSDHIK
jgi:hypothetical protein